MYKGSPFLTSLPEFVLGDFVGLIQPARGKMKSQSCFLICIPLTARDRELFLSDILAIFISSFGNFCSDRSWTSSFQYLRVTCIHLGYQVVFHSLLYSGTCRFHMYWCIADYRGNLRNIHQCLHMFYHHPSVGIQASICTGKGKMRMVNITAIACCYWLSL